MGQLSECIWTLWGASAGQLVVAIVTSLIASTVFWFVFDRVPRWFAQRKVQPLIDYDLYQVYTALLFFLETPFRHPTNVAARIQHEINSGRVTKEMFRTALSTKCLTEEYRTVDVMAKNMEAIGGRLQNEADSITRIITQLYVFNHYLSADQILLCRQILDAINRYSYDMPAYMRGNNGEIFHPVNPTINYMSEAFFELYSFYRKLQDYLIRSKSGGIFANYHGSLDYTRTSILLEQNKLQSVIKKTKKANSSLLELLRLTAIFRSKGADAVRGALASFLRCSKLQLVSLRYGLEEMIFDETLKETIIEERSQSEYVEMVSCLKKEDAQDEQFWLLAREMERFYDEKVWKRN